MTDVDWREEALKLVYTDRFAAHQVLFEKRHPNRSPEFHKQIIQDFHSSAPLVCEIGFRESAKSTIAEEAVTIQGALREFEHCLIVGSTESLAKARVHSIRRQYERNEILRQVLGNMVGQPWGDGLIELRNGVQIQAMGRGQSIRGTKAEDYRPDLILLDDIEDPESVRTPEGREKTEAWLFTELLPAGDSARLRVRMLSNDRHPECIANRLKAAGSGWTVRVFPWVYQDDAGETMEDGSSRLWLPTWPDRFPVDHCRQVRRRFYALGRGAEYEQEYMCTSTHPADKPFKKENFRVEPRVRTWQPVMSIFDPARTVKNKSAHTGYVTGGWIGHKLVIWESWGKLLLPSEIIDAVFQAHKDWNPLLIGFEEDGLNEWAMQPIRAEQSRRHTMLPLKGLKAPRGKMDFIRGIQPWFTAREIEFVSEMPELQAQLLSFPTGRIDVPNALAYLILLRPGAPIYDDFRQEHVMEDIQAERGRRAWLALNANTTMTTAALVQMLDGQVRILADWVREGPADEVLGDIIREANLEAGQQVAPISPPFHFERLGNVGLLAAGRRVPVEIRRGAQPSAGAGELRAALRRVARFGPVCAVSSRARWTLNALAGGYTRKVGRNGALGDEAEDGPYRVLMEGIEALMGAARLQPDDVEDQPGNMDYTRDGRAFLSARARR